MFVGVFLVGLFIICMTPFCAVNFTWKYLKSTKRTAARCHFQRKAWTLFPPKPFLMWTVCLSATWTWNFLLIFMENGTLMCFFPSLFVLSTSQCFYLLLRSFSASIFLQLFSKLTEKKQRRSIKKRLFSMMSDCLDVRTMKSWIEMNQKCGFGSDVSSFSLNLLIFLSCLLSVGNENALFCTDCCFSWP